MGEEIVLVNGIQVPHRVVRIPGDGACLFSSLSYLIHGDISMVAQIRADIVRHVTINWQRFQPFTEDASGVPYTNQLEYIAEMSQPYTFGNTCELKAAGEIFPFKLEIFQDGILRAEFGEVIQGINRLRFTGHHRRGHFDVLIPLVQKSNNSIVQQPPTISEPIECELNSSSFVSQPQLTPCAHPVSCYETVTSVTTPVTGGRGKKRRKRFTNAIRSKQLKEAASNYAKNNPNVNRKAVQKYANNNPDVNRKAVKTYAANNPCIIKAAAAKHHEKNKQMRLLPWTIKSLTGFKYDPQIDYSNEKVVTLGSRSLCSWCSSLKWMDEAPGMCCRSGKVQLPALELYPEPLHSLLTHQHSMAEHFLSNARKYNGCFQMTSFGSKEKKEGNFMPTFKVQGQVYHRIGSLLPEPQQQPSFLQIYFVGDDDSERDIRCGIYNGVNADLVMQLQKLLHEHNRYILDFKVAVDSVPKGQKDFQVVIKADKKPSGEQRGRYNAPTNKEIAVLIVGQDFEKRDIVIHSRDNKLIQISETHRSYDALQYPLIFCRGEDGYQINIPQHDPKTHAPLKKTVSAADFYSYNIMERDGEQCYILLFRNLFNQYLVDMYAKIETERLNWIRFNQKKLRSEEYVHLKDAMTSTEGQLSELTAIHRCEARVPASNL